MRCIICSKTADCVHNGNSYCKEHNPSYTLGSAPFSIVSEVKAKPKVRRKK